jgi:hypothetical protein
LLRPSSAGANGSLVRFVVDAAVVNRRARRNNSSRQRPVTSWKNRSNKRRSLNFNSLPSFVTNLIE